MIDSYLEFGIHYDPMSDIAATLVNSDWNQAQVFPSIDNVSLAVDPDTVYTSFPWYTWYHPAHSVVNQFKNDPPAFTYLVAPNELI